MWFTFDWSTKFHNKSIIFKFIRTPTLRSICVRCITLPVGDGCFSLFFRNGIVLYVSRFCTIYLSIYLCVFEGVSVCIYIFRLAAVPSDTSNNRSLNWIQSIINSQKIGRYLLFSLYIFYNILDNLLSSEHEINQMLFSVQFYIRF